MARLAPSYGAGGNPAPLLVVGDITIDERRGGVSRERCDELTAREYSILELWCAIGHLVTRSAICEHI